jgi:transposase-like protein
MGQRYKAKERERLIEAVHASAEPVKVIAKRLGVKESTAYYWMKRARRAEPPKFVRVVPTTQTSRASLSVDVGGVLIRVDAGFDAELLREVVVALKGGLI